MEAPGMKAVFAIIFVTSMIAAFFVLDISPQGSAGILYDGYYTAEEADYYRGWREYLTIYVSNGKIVTCEYNAKNASGFIKSWDMNYMRRMNESDGNYPDKFARNYVYGLLANQGLSGIDAMSGATESHRTFIKLASVALVQALSGDYEVVFVKVRHN
jgi:major membrane immunogen (membrane-anchored lipoprotein)